MKPGRKRSRLGLIRDGTVRWGVRTRVRQKTYRDQDIACFGYLPMISYGGRTPWGIGLRQPCWSRSENGLQTNLPLPGPLAEHCSYRAGRNIVPITPDGTNTVVPQSFTLRNHVPQRPFPMRLEETPLLEPWACFYLDLPIRFDPIACLVFGRSVSYFPLDPGTKWIITLDIIPIILNHSPHFNKPQLLILSFLVGYLS